MKWKITIEIKDPRALEYIVQRVMDTMREAEADHCTVERIE